MSKFAATVLKPQSIWDCIGLRPRRRYRWNLTDQLNGIQINAFFNTYSVHKYRINNSSRIYRTIDHSYFCCASLCQRSQAFNERSWVVVYMRAQYKLETSHISSNLSSRRKPFTRMLIVNFKLLLKLNTNKVPKYNTCQPATKETFGNAIKY